MSGFTSFQVLIQHNTETNHFICWDVKNDSLVTIVSEVTKLSS